MVYKPDRYNCEPVVQANGIYDANVNEEITFDSVGSFDAEGDILSYHWDFGDGTEKDGNTITYVYPAKGIYPITLTAIDKDGKSGIDTAWAFIETTNNPTDRPIIEGPARVANLTWENYTFSTTDPEMDDVYYYIDWDKSEVDEWLGPYKSGEAVTLVHYWVFRDTYNLRVKAKDMYGYESDWATLELRVSKDKAFFTTPFQQFLETYSYLFPLLRHLQEF